MELDNQIQLELYFADHFDTVLFSVLADIYYNQDDLKRARRVCEIGLRHHKNDVSGMFVLAQVEKAEGNLKETEKILEKIIVYCDDHLAATEMLCEIYTVLGRAQTKLLKSWKRLLKLDPMNHTAIEFVKKVEGEKIKSGLNQKGSNKKTKNTIKEKNRSIKKKLPKKDSLKTIQQIDKTINPLNVSARLATFTLVAVLKNQGLFEQALDVLDVLEEKNEKKERIEQERKTIKVLIKKSKEVE
ncbi:MAG: hypothetical protein CMG62_06785 [Candidatus Marinimicrobia bacterium]|nr:hypothetical protein [Candidatus Neomarinimicrobiota bacterium]